jgi:hypothetical protein
MPAEFVGDGLCAPLEAVLALVHADTLLGLKFTW